MATFYERFHGRLSIVDARGQPQGAALRTTAACPLSAAVGSAASLSREAPPAPAAATCWRTTRGEDAPATPACTMTPPSPSPAWRGPAEASALAPGDGAPLAFGVGFLRALAARQREPQQPDLATTGPVTTTAHARPALAASVPAGRLAAQSGERWGSQRAARPIPGHPWQRQRAATFAVVVSGAGVGFNIGRNDTSEGGDDAAAAGPPAPPPHSRTRHVGYTPASMSSYRRLMEASGMPLPPEPQRGQRQGGATPAAAADGGRVAALDGLTPAQAAALAALLARRAARERARAYGGGVTARAAAAAAAAAGAGARASGARNRGLAGGSGSSSADAYDDGACDLPPQRIDGGIEGADSVSRHWSLGEGGADASFLLGAAPASVETSRAAVSVAAAAAVAAALPTFDGGGSDGDAAWEGGDERFGGDGGDAWLNSGGYSDAAGSGGDADGDDAPGWARRDATSTRGDRAVSGAGAQVAVHDGRGRSLAPRGGAGRWPRPGQFIGAGSSGTAPRTRAIAAAAPLPPPPHGVPGRGPLAAAGTPAPRGIHAPLSRRDKPAASASSARMGVPPRRRDVAAPPFVAAAPPRRAAARNSGAPPAPSLADLQALHDELRGRVAAEAELRARG